MTNFIKYNYNGNDTYIKESEDLKLLEKHLDTAFIKIPKIINVSNQELELERILVKKSTEASMVKLGIGLAKLHQIKFEQYGYEKNNFIGLSVQKNELSNNWGEFFFQNRLHFQVSMIKTASIRNNLDEILREKRSAIVDFLNANCEHPSLVHGDLWSGNVLFDDSNVWLIDPSSYYADREVDIAMSELFLGFSTSFYEAYNKVYPLCEAYEKKKIIYNLYHYLNHYNLFGHSYLEECNKAFRFIQTL